MSVIETKICGITTPDALEAAIEGGAAYIGLIFYPPSPRYVSPGQAAALSHRTSSTVTKVGVFVNPSFEELQAILATVPLDSIQLHGAETPGRVQEIRAHTGKPIIKAIPVRTGDDIAGALAYQEVADMLLFDAKAPKESALPGGTGLTFDWELLAGRDFPLPWFLSGGLNPNNVAEAVRRTGARMVDVSSSLEKEPGVKDVELIKAFMDGVKG